MTQANEQITHEFAVGGQHGKPFLIQRLWNQAHGVEEVVIDGVRCAPEALRKLFVSPRTDRLLRFERECDTLTVHSYAVEAVEVDDAENVS